MPVWLGALVGVAALLVAAKAHGRQVRLEREAAGYHEVVFGGQNPPFVDALWRADRIRFWTFAPAAALLLAPAAFLAKGWPLALLAALLWAPIAAFHFAGLWRYAHTRQGNPAWWLAALLSFAASVTLALA